MSNRRLVMYNDFVIIGPRRRPREGQGAAKAADALKRIAESQARFVSRGDKSGTHVLEQALWKQAGIEPKGAWYIESGQGMGQTLGIANDRRAYTLTDRGTLARVPEARRPADPRGEGPAAPEHLLGDGGQPGQRPARQRGGRQGLRRLHAVARDAGRHQDVRRRQVRPAALRPGGRARRTRTSSRSGAAVRGPVREGIRRRPLRPPRSPATPRSGAITLALAPGLRRAPRCSRCSSASRSAPLLALTRFPGRALVVSLVNTGMGLPPGGGRPLRDDPALAQRPARRARAALHADARWSSPSS